MKKQNNNARISAYSTKQFIHRNRVILLCMATVMLFALYLNTANNHFYHRLHTAGLPWPQNQISYTLGDVTQPSIKYVALGDSLTSGVGAQSFDETYSYRTAQQILKPHQSIILTPLSTPGYKSIDLVNHYLDKAVEIQPDIVTILIGVNDVHGLGPSQSEFKTNYETLIRRLSTETHARIYAIAIPFIGTDELIWTPYRQYYSSRTKTLNMVIRKLSDKYSVGYIDLYSNTIDLTDKPSTYYSRDDFHPSSEGYKIWSKIIADGINN